MIFVVKPSLFNIRPPPSGIIFLFGSSIIIFSIKLFLEEILKDVSAKFINLFV